jgi:phenylalanyl-tRNA synthetase beta chain
MGGRTTELPETTSHVVIEAAHFEPPTISRTAPRHKLPSEASKRFERGVDPLLPAYAADRVAGLLVEHGGGTVAAGVTYVGAPPASTTITADVDLPGRITGMAIDAETTVAHLRTVGCTVTVADDGATLTVLPPTWRPDLTDPYDLVEEVARIVGYTSVPSVLPAAPSGRGLTREQRLRRRVGFALAGAGLVEVKSWPFVGSADFDRLGLADEDVLRSTIRIANPLSEERPLLTTTLLPGLLETAARNIGRGTGSVAIYETAPVFFPTPDRRKAPILGVDGRPDDADLRRLMAAVPHQPLTLAAVLTGEAERSGWWGPGRPTSWADAVQVVREVARVLGVEVEVVQAVRAPWHPGRCAQLRVDGRELGHAGELHPSVCAAYGVPARTAAVEVNLELLISQAPAVVQSVPFSSYPVAKEDVAFELDAAVAAGDVVRTIREAAGELLESVRVFDVYTGAPIPAGKKSLAFALRFRAPDRTLTEAETAEARDRAVAAVVREFGAVHRA